MTSALPVLDFNVLEKLSRFNSSGTSLDLALVKLFIESSVLEFDSLTSTNTLKLSEISDRAHALKSSSASIGLIFLSNLCEHLESEAENNHDLRPVLLNIKLAVQDAIEALKKYVKIKSTKAS